MARHVRKGDKVIVTAGRDKGKTGKVLRIQTKDDRVVVEGINVRRKNLKPTQDNPRGGAISVEMPIHISNVSPVDSENKATRVRFETKADGSKVRLAATTGEELSVLKKAR